MKVLLLTHHFPPDREVGAVRAFAVADALRRAGAEVTVLTVDKPGVEVLLADQDRNAPHGFELLAVGPWPTSRDLYRRIKRLFVRSHGGPENGFASWPDATAPGYIPPAWRRFIVSLLVLPDGARGFVPPAVLRVLRLRGNFDWIYTSGPPHSTHLAGLLIRLLTRSAWAAEFRDPWTDNPGKAPGVRSALSDAVERGLEAICLRSATTVIANSRGTYEHLRKRMGTRADRILLVRNGLPALPVPTPPARATGPFRLRYFGTLYLGRDPRPLIEAAATLAGRLSRDLFIEFYGDCTRFHNIDVREYARSHGVDNMIRILPPVPRDQAIALMRSSDALLLLAQDQPMQVPQKLYEYLMAGRPIFALADRPGETVEMLEQLSGHVIVDSASSVRIVAERLDALVNTEWKGPSARDLDELRPWLVENQMRMIVGRLSGTAS